jgi:hypothetical protein
VIQSLTPLSVFAQTLALINGTVAIGTILLRLCATRCGTLIVRKNDPSMSIADPTNSQNNNDESRVRLLDVN